MKKRINHLLIIAIDTYRIIEFPNLDNAVRDAKALIEVLQTRYSFELFQEPLFNEQATKKNIYDAFNTLVAAVGEEDNVVIFFAGHGRQHTGTGKGYWIPTDANNAINDFISNAEIKDFIEAMRARHVFLIADACFAGTFLTRTRGLVRERSYELLDSKVSRWMLASGGEEPVSDGRNKESSPFARFLLKYLTLNDSLYTSVREIIRYVSVLTAKHSRQHPQGAEIDNIGHQDGEMVFQLNDSWVRQNPDKSRGEPHTSTLLQELYAANGRRYLLSAGKEIVLVASPVKPDELMILELFRFNDEGGKKVSFRDNKLIMPGIDDEAMEWTVIQRFATWKGFERFWDANEQAYAGHRVLIANAAPEIEHVEETPIAIWKQQYLQDLLDARAEPMRCLHCGEMVTTNDGYLVEIDETGLQEAAGNVHADCLRPVDRILGKMGYEGMEKDSNLVNFDYPRWLSLLEKGQGLVAEAHRVGRKGTTPVLAWNRGHRINTGEFAIRFRLSDGSGEYVTLGRKIHRFPGNKIEEEVDFIRDFLEAAIKAGDPWSYTSERRTFGTRSKLEALKGPDERILEITDLEKIRYSAQMEIHQDIQNDYTPLGLVLDSGTKTIINFGNCVPLIADVARFEQYHANWNMAGYAVGSCAIQILASDQELDAYLAGFFRDGMQPVIDPQFDEQQELISGTYISDIDDLTRESEERSYIHVPNPTWKAGDRVKVVFPDIGTDKNAEGIVSGNEMIDNESGESFALFTPIDEGMLRNDLTVVLPTRLLVRM